MKRAMVQKTFVRQRGLSLLELMVALAIGLILLLALATLMTVANRSSMNRSRAELIDETARQVFSRLEMDFRQAGYVDPFDNNKTLSETFDLSDGTRMARYIRQKDYFTSADKNQLTLLGQLSKGRLQPVKGCAGRLDPVTGNCVTIPNTPRHSIQVSYQVVSTAAPADPANPLAGTAQVNVEQKTESNGLQACANVNADQEFPIVVNRYFFSDSDVANAVTAPRDLQCDSAVSNYDEFAKESKRTQVPIQTGVEEMVFRYLVTPTEDTLKTAQVDYANVVSGRSVTQYLSAEEVEATPLGWASVVGVEVCLVIAVQPLDGKREITMAGTQPKVPTCLRQAGNTKADAEFRADVARPSNWSDLREYRRYVRTFSLPNTLYLSNVKI